MKPYDGSGYGKSNHWTYKIRSIAKEKGEYCQCWDDDNPVYLIEGHSIKDVVFKISCEKRRETCKRSFTETEKDVAVIFKNMYKL